MRPRWVSFQTVASGWGRRPVLKEYVRPLCKRPRSVWAGGTSRKAAGTAATPGRAAS